MYTAFPDSPRLYAGNKENCVRIRVVFATLALATLSGGAGSSSWPSMLDSEHHRRSGKANRQALVGASSTAAVPLSTPSQLSDNPAFRSLADGP
jgi:hypothetical protein